MYTLNKKIVNLVPYEPISGTYDIRLDANECPFDLPADIREEIKTELDRLAFNRYPDPLATSVVNAFADYYGLDPALVTAGNGSDELIFLIEAAFLEKGDRMLVVSPDFSMYNFYSSICEVECDSFVKNDSLDIDVDALIERVSRDNIKLVMFSNPCNPTGRGITADEARRLVTSVEALVILDEAYMDFWSESLLGEVAEHDNLIIFRTASKAVGCAALRLGFAVANETISRAVKAVKSPYNVNSFSQAAGAVVYRHKEYLQNRQKMIVKSRETLYNGLAELSETTDLQPVPACANFVFVKTGSARAIWEYLRERSIVVRLMGDNLRITAGTVDEVEKVLDSIKEYFGVR